MSGNTFGTIFRLTTYGESHGPALGGVVDGCPPGVPVSEEILQRDLDRRRPGAGGLTGTARKEPDAVRLLSGVFEGETTGTPIGFVIENTDQRSRDYEAAKTLLRPGHADGTYLAKYGRRDYRGGGRASARETAARVAGGAVAGALLARAGIRVVAYTVELGGIPALPVDVAGAADRPFCAPDPDVIPLWEARAREAMATGDSLGGIVEVVATGVPAGLGEPVFDKLDARLAYALMGVGAVKGVEIGNGFAAARLLGSQNNDPIVHPPVSNNAGGILGGIASGQPVVARAAVKPIPSIAVPQRTMDIDGEPAEIVVGGRHDRSAIPRVVPVLRAMVLLVLADLWLAQKTVA
ncbi:chorismate synthase [Solidesulfovibrio carbinoliphilus subsp. oakridgensis]|uniref:Chorismate synthase n=1 Tax=Solidesulfovibrio carbinoliphilus subsp. oakridgensis TaxID=694327 RepID=G7Q849_9BACT|nr:chorismate synthase [Solidesulfovibrio carbinoliphilus]EHJ48063.1 chorismate synthase [Solidesulfovibrio carbinoliphilus subsp. oakridgensis]